MKSQGLVCGNATFSLLENYLTENLSYKRQLLLGTRGLRTNQFIVLQYYGHL